ncbi:MAG: T9SS type A sorting domain-containing protein [Flavobacteriales bacterium]|nr:T9SS type A sorting domain-containing protein [Flavobacteriales bacterium]
MRHLSTFAALLSGLFLFAQDFTTWTTDDGLPTNNLRDVAVAADGTIWLATQSGVSAFDGSTFETHTTTSHPGLATNDVMAIEVTANGDVWAGTDLGVSVFDGTSYTTYTTVDGLSDDQVKNIKQAPNGDVWLGTINGATLYSNGTFTAFGSPDIPFGGVQYIAFADNGNVWLAGGLGGIIIYNGSTFSTMTTANGLLSNRIRSIAIDAAQNKWVATAQGISTFDALDQHSGDHTRPFILPAPDTLNPATDIVIDGQGTVWSGIYVDYLVTEGGVSAYNGSGWTQYEEVDGLAGPNVRRLAVDAEDAVWVTTSTGLTRITSPSIGLNERSVDPLFSLYPNPTSDRVNLEIAMEGMVQVQLFDIGGRLLRSDASNGRLILDVADLSIGTYFVRIGNRVEKLVVAR